MSSATISRLVQVSGAENCLDGDKCTKNVANITVPQPTQMTHSLQPADIPPPQSATLCFHPI